MQIYAQIRLTLLFSIAEVITSSATLPRQGLNKASTPEASEQLNWCNPKAPLLVS